MSPLTGLVLNLLMGPPSHGFRRGLGPLRGLAPLHSNPVSQQGMWDMLSPKGEGKKSKNLSLLPRGEGVPTRRDG